MKNVQFTFYEVLTELTEPYVEFYVDDAWRSQSNMPKDAALSMIGWSDQILFYDESGKPIKSMHQILNELPVDFEKIQKSKESTIKPEKPYVLEWVYWKDPKYGLIKLRAAVVHYVIRIRRKEAEDIGQAIVGQFVQRLQAGRLLPFSPSGQPTPAIPPMEMTISPALFSRPSSS